MLNQEQWISLVRGGLAAGGPIAALLLALHVATQPQIDALQTVLLWLFSIVPPVVSFVWGIFAHTQSAAISTVEAMPGVGKITVLPSASNDLKDIAADTSRPKVEMQGTPPQPSMAAGMTGTRAPNPTGTRP
jgi:hypothetical protein